LAGAIWVIGYLAMFALRLPVSYQHGRYAMPAMPVYFVLGLSGLYEVVRRSSGWRSGRVLNRAWLLATVLLSLGFLVLGASAYRRDVEFINEEMVSTAHWLARNTEKEALIAVHDIGAIGYYGGRRLIDLAGLVSPQVIPIIRDEAALARYLDEQGAGYLVTFPGWYPELAARGSPVYASSGRVSPSMGGENMVVYRWRTAP
jgi:hypothetical protein